MTDSTSPEPASLQLAVQLRKQIVSGEIASRLPSIPTLTSEACLAVGTVRRAIRVLADEHLVSTVPGRGTYVIAQGATVPRRPRACTPPALVPSLARSLR